MNNFQKNCIKSFLSLVLTFAAAQSIAESKVDTAIEDSAITSVIKTKMVADNMVSASDIHVTTQKGIVFLEGNVKSHTEADKAVELASSTSGVVDVDTSHLTVQGSQQPISDAVITAKIKGLYLREKAFGEKPISVNTVHVETKEGVVYLSGEADNKAQIETAEQLAKSVKGVKQVKSTITIKNN